jgi:hypothetical protein
VKEVSCLLTCFMECCSLCSLHLRPGPGPSDITEIREVKRGYGVLRWRHLSAHLFAFVDGHLREAL